MAKRKINAAMILAAGEDAHLQINENVSHAKPIDGEYFVELNLDEIENNPMQPRIDINDKDLEELAHSIRLHGLIQPISVIKVEGKKYILKAGQRRWLAHKRLGLKKIKAIVEEESKLPKKERQKALFETAILENIQRNNLNPLELALSLRQAMDKKIYHNLDELSQALGKSKSYLSKVMKVLHLDEKIIHDINKNKSTNDVEALYEIQKIEDKERQVKIYKAFIDKKIDRKGLRELNKRDKDIENKPPYKIQISHKKMNLEVPLNSLDEREKKAFDKEIKALLERYFS